SINAGTFPGPTPNAGLPELYAARTRPVPPVARITAVRLCFIRASVPSTVATDMQAMMPFGAPADSAAFAITLVDSRIHCAAEGCGLSTTQFRDLIEIRHLKTAVEVGFVEGMIAATTPRGKAISIIDSDSRITPTVRMFLNAL